MEREEALKQIRNWSLPEETREVLETLIPELAESEDEKMCTRCIDLLRKVSAYSGEEYLGVEIADCIIWLQALRKKLKESLHITEICKEDADSFTDEHKYSYGDRELPQLAKVKATGKIVNIIHGTLSIGEKRRIAYSSDKEDGYKLYSPDELFFLDTECKSEERFKEAREKYQVEWSEEDYQLIGFIFDLLNDLAWRKDWTMSKEECLERLKSLRRGIKDVEL